MKKLLDMEIYIYNYEAYKLMDGFNIRLNPAEEKIILTVIQT